MTPAKRMRNTSIELLRILMMMLILTIHVYGHGSHLNYEWIYSLGNQPSTAWNLSLFSLGKIGVTGFIFISGYFGIHIKRRSLEHLLLITLFYAAILGVIFHQYHPRQLLSLLYAFDTWWFVSAYIFIMLLAPFLEEGIKRITQRQYILLLGGMLFYEYFMRFLQMDNSHDALFLLTVYLFARYVKIYSNSKLALAGRRGGVICLILILLVPVAISLIGFKVEKLNALFISNNNICLLLASYSIVAFSESHVFHNKCINRLASGSLAIYLITD